MRDRLYSALCASLLRADVAPDQATKLAEVQASVLREFYAGMVITGRHQQRAHLRAGAVVRLRSQGKTFREIGQQLGISAQGAYRLFRTRVPRHDNSSGAAC